MTAAEDFNNKQLLLRDSHIIILKDLEIKADNFISNTPVMTAKEKCTLKAYEFVIIDELDKIKDMYETIMESTNDKWEIYKETKDLVFLKFEVQRVLLMIQNCLNVENLSMGGDDPTNTANQPRANISQGIIQQEESQLVFNSNNYCMHHKHERRK